MLKLENGARVAWGTGWGPVPCGSAIWQAIDEIARDMSENSHHPKSGIDAISFEI